MRPLLLLSMHTFLGWDPPDMPKAGPHKGSAPMAAGHVALAAPEQMLLCTLLPFGPAELPDFKALQEVPMTVHWRYHELRFTSAVSTVTMQISRLTTVSNKWIHLTNMPYCRVTALMNTAPGPSGPVILSPAAIRIYINKDAFGPRENFNAKLCEPNVLAFETLLADVIGEVPYVIENPEPAGRKRRIPWDMNMKVVEASPTVNINNGLMWNFLDRTLTLDRQPNQELRIWPIMVVSDACDAWICHVLSSVALILPRRKPGPIGSGSRGLVGAPQAALVVTRDTELWSSQCREKGLTVEVMGPLGLPVEALSGANIVLCTPDMWASNMAHTELLLDSVETALSCNTTHACSRHQVKRVLFDNILPKFEKFIVPADLIQYGCVILDDIEALYDTHGIGLFNVEPGITRLLQIVRSPQLKPRTLPRTATEMAFPYCGAPMNSWTRAVLWYASETLVQAVPVPRPMLRKVKIVSHAVKNGPVEECVTKTFAHKYCPIAMADAIQRFSGQPVPEDVAQSLIARHFDRLDISLGCFLSRTHVNDEASRLSRPYLQTSISVPEKTCCICFDAIPGNDYRITICGHTYCSDCAPRHFGPEWETFRAKDCAACRCPVLQGDTFHIQPVERFLPASTSKVQAIEAFLESVRQPAYTHVYTDEWTSERFPNTRHLVVSNISALSPRELMRRVQSAHGVVNVHMFYMPDEAAAFQDFSTAF